MIDAGLLARAREAGLLWTATERLGARLKRKSAAEWEGPCPLCGGTDRFAINDNKHRWNCRGCGRGGVDAISLVSHILSLDFRGAVTFLAGDERKPTPPPPRPDPPVAEKDDAFVAWLVAGIIRELVPIGSGTPGARYLREIRKIDTDAIADVLERTDAIGWHPSVLFREKGHALDGRKLGCLVGVMTDAVTARPTGAISRTYLDADLRKIGKAKTLGRPAGIVRLSPDDEVLEGLHLAEGLESALDGMSKGFRPMWSTGSSGLMASFPQLSGVEALTIFADNDRNGAGLSAANEVAARQLAAGCEVNIYLRATPGDINDAFRESGQ